MKFLKIGILAIFLSLSALASFALAGGCGSLIYIDDGSGGSSSGSSSDTWKNEPAYVPITDSTSSSGGKPDFIVKEICIKHKNLTFIQAYDII